MDNHLKLKIWKASSIVVIFLLSFLVRNMYYWFPSFITSLLFPINDSIWQFNKVIILSFLIWSVFEKLTIRKKHDLNTCTSGLIAALTCAVLFILITHLFIFIFLTKNLIYSLCFLFTLFVLLLVFY